VIEKAKCIFLEQLLAKSVERGNSCKDCLSGSLEVDDLLAFKELLKTASVESSTSDHKAGDTCGIDGFLALLLELECHFVLDDLLDGFGGHGSALLLNRCQVDGSGVTEQTNDEVAANEADSLT